MSILEKDVLVNINGSNSNYYEKIGYEIPKRIDKYGKLRIENGTKILVKLEHLQEGSGTKVTKVCDDCGKIIPNQQYATMLIRRKQNDGKDRCQSCGGVYNRKKQKSNIQYENSLEYYAKNNSKEYLLDEFSNKNAVKASKVYKTSSEEYLWDCPKCNSEYDMRLSDRTLGNQNCPYCAGKRVNHTNCLWTTHPKIAKLLKNPEKGYKLTRGDICKEEFTCSHCGNVEIKRILNVVKCGFSCSKCSDGISYPEKFIFNILDQLDVEFETQKTFRWSWNKKYDFYIPSLNCIIETHGGQHYKETTRGRNLEEEQENDRIKEQLAKENGIKNYIVIDCRKSELEWIKSSVVISSLEELLDLTKVKWLKCHEYACGTLVKTVCDLWNSGIENTVEIGKILKLSKGTVQKHLKSGTELKWCDYDPKEASRKASIIAGKSKGIEVVQLSKNGEFLNQWKSIMEASRTLKISDSSISVCCRGRYKLAGGYRWMYKKDYEDENGEIQVVDEDLLENKKDTK